MPTKTFVNLTDDVCFKYIFCKEEILKDFINSFFAFINKKERVVRVKTNTQKEMFGKKRQNKVFYGDILVYTNTKKILIIEMYNNFQKEEFNKSISYLTRIFSNQLERGESYLNVKKVIGINFMKGNYNYNNFYLINEYGFINKLNYGSIKDECLEMYMVRLDLIREKVYNYSDIRFIKWLKLINAKDMMEMKKISEGDEIMEQTLKFMDEFLNDEEIRNVYDKIRDVEYHAKKEGLADGLAEGHANMLNSAKKMLDRGMSIQVIEEITGLTKKEIESLQ